MPNTGRYLPRTPSKRTFIPPTPPKPTYIPPTPRKPPKPTDDIPTTSIIPTYVPPYVPPTPDRPVSEWTKRGWKRVPKNWVETSDGSWRLGRYRGEVPTPPPQPPRKSFSARMAAEQLYEQFRKARVRRDAKRELAKLRAQELAARVQEARAAQEQEPAEQQQQLAQLIPRGRRTRRGTRGSGATRRLVTQGSRYSRSRSKKSSRYSRSRGKKSSRYSRSRSKKSSRYSRTKTRK